MANYDNLTPMKPGETRNPNGRPKGSKNISTILRELLEGELNYKDSTSGKIKKMKGSEAVAHSVIKTALNEMASNENAKLKAAEIIMDRLEGKPVQKIEDVTEPTTNEEALEKIRVIAKQEGLTFEEYCEREGINYE